MVSRQPLPRWSIVPPWRVITLFVLLLWCIQFVVRGTRHVLLQQDASSPSSSVSVSSIAMPTESLLGTDTFTALSHSTISTDSVGRSASGAPFCTASQRKAIEIALPDNNGHCSSNKNMWSNKCIITKKTGCPDPSWLHSHYQKRHSHHFHSFTGSPRTETTTMTTTTSSHFLAINIGCNKGFDAITYLRMGRNNNESISKAQWRRYMPPNLQPGVCSQEDNEYILPSNFNRSNSSSTSTSSSMISSATTSPTASVLCVEPVTQTFTALQSAASHFPGLHVLKYAVNNEKHPNVTMFPKQTTVNTSSANTGGTTTVGVEKESSNNCYSQRPTRQARLMKQCEAIPTTRLDLLLHQEGYDQTDVHILLIDVEGWDYEVLKGGMQTLSRTHYLEFEYNWRGMWWQQKDDRPLHQAISTLNQMHFTCYWAGQQKLWLITNCWLPHYDGVFWSNVVCVNRVLSPVLAQSMHDLFLNTIQDS